MIPADPPALVPAGSPHQALLGESSPVLWTPEASVEHDYDAHQLNWLLDDATGARIREGEQMVPHLHDAVRERASKMLKSEAFETRLRRQFGSFSDQLNKRWPNALLAREQAIEDALQTTAAGGRAALAMTGELLADPVEWEDDLAAVILNDPSMPLTLEARRQPRPSVPAPPCARDAVWAKIGEHVSGISREGVEAAGEDDRVLWATLTQEPVSHLATVTGGPHHDWYWLGTYESRAVRLRDHQHERDLFATQYRMLEVRDADDKRAFDMPPVSKGSYCHWTVEVQTVPETLLSISQPLVGIDNEFQMTGDCSSGLGLPRTLLVPAPVLIATLGLQPGEEWTFVDKSGPALVLITWRAEYDVSDYYLGCIR